MKKITKYVLGFIVAGLIISLGYVIHWGYLHYQETYDTGTRSGIVIDAETGKPIEGAVVDFVWLASDFLSMTESSRGYPVAEFEILTDKEGKYYIPNQQTRIKSMVTESLTKESVLIFKNGYAAYETYNDYDKMFGRNAFVNEKQVYNNIDNNVLLYSWKDNWSHSKHIEWLQNTIKGRLMEKELEMEKELANQERQKK
jgi:hypothetical protein